MVNQCWVAISPEKVSLPGWSMELIIGNYGYLGIIVVLRELRVLHYHCICKQEQKQSISHKSIYVHKSFDFTQDPLFAPPFFLTLECVHP
jgi:hypothetical protein